MCIRDRAYIDFLSFGGTNPDGTTAKALSKGYLRLFSAVLQGAFRFAVFPKRLITFNPMQYVVWRGKKEECAPVSYTHLDVYKRQMLWVVRMNEIQARAREIINREIIYT